MVCLKVPYSYRLKLRMVLTLLCAVWLPGMLAPSQPTGEPDDMVEAIEGLLTGINVPSVLREMRDFDRLLAAVQQLYASRDYAPLWLEEGEAGAHVRRACDKLARAYEHGLRPGDYLFGPLDTGTMGNFQAGDRTLALARIDLALSLSSLRYVKDLHEGRFSPRQLALDLDVAHRTLDLVEELRAILAAEDPETAVDARAPALEGYWLLKRELARYREIASTDPWRPLHDAAVVRPGDPYPDLGALRHRLVLAGDLAEDSRGTGDVYEGEVVEGVRRFQLRHGRTEDGIIGKETFACLNVPWSDRVAQIATGLERWRWLPDTPTGRAIVVNVPAYVLRAYSFDGERPTMELQSRVIVGKSYHRYQTPIFSGRIRYLEFRPRWNVPRSIIRNELLPKLDQPGYLDDRGYEIVPSFGPDVEPLPVTAENVVRVRKGTLQIRQRPGPNNALGLVKFIFPNEHDVYLHDTPARSLFEEARRDFSHGCIRVGRPADLAAWVLAGTPEWDRAAIDRAMSEGGPTRVTVEGDVPVFILYTTAFSDPDTGLLFFSDDIYGLDEELARKLGLTLSERVRRTMTAVE
jgi:murein L,D-transpeptidase YcbB/YkuD